MSDQKILDRWNEGVRARDQVAAEYEHIAVEVPPGKPQIEYFEKGYQWTPRGDVLRCVIDDGGPDGEPVIDIDDPRAVRGRSVAAPLKRWPQTAFKR